MEDDRQSCEDYYSDEDEDPTGLENKESEDEEDDNTNRFVRGLSLEL